MTDQAVELRAIDWQRTFPFVRLFRPMLSIAHVARIVPALLCVLACYLVGRSLDGIWTAASAGVVETAPASRATTGGLANEIEAYAALPAAEFHAWKHAARPDGGKPAAAAGPFITLLDYEMRCFAAAIQGVCAGRLGFSSDGRPAMLGAVTDALKGALWLVTQRPWYALIYGLLHVLIFGFAGAAIARHAVVHSARDENIRLGGALRFAQEKWLQTALTPLILVAAILALGVLLIVFSWIVGLLTLIPAVGLVGYVIGGLIYGLALLVGVALVAAAVGLVGGLHLMTPTIAAESSDAMDALSRSVNYVFSRPFHVLFYGVAGLAYGAVCFVVVRLGALLLLKLTHTFTKIGMSSFGWWHNVNATESLTTDRLSAMWRMPSWNELPLLPATGGTPFWGTFANAPLSSGETAGMWLIAAWVFLVVGLVGAFVVSFYFSTSTEIYLLLRRHIDATDYEDVFYEPTGDDPYADVESAAGGSGASPGDAASGSGGSAGDKPANGTSLPVMNPPGGGGK
ncbi:MAG: hypothetical protein AB7Q17_17440 [Phycisphaerae bacterium]